MLASAPKIAQEASQGRGDDAGEAHQPQPGHVGDRVARVAMHPVRMRRSCRRTRRRARMLVATRCGAINCASTAARVVLGREERRRQEEMQTYLALGGSGVIIAVGRSTQRRTGPVSTCADASTLGQVLLALGLPDLDLLLLATAAQLLRLEGALRLELSSAMLGNVPISHDCGTSDGGNAVWVVVAAMIREEEGVME